MTKKLRLLFVLLLCWVAPAYANNPPQPDGLFSILLIFPAVILGRRLAGITPGPKSLANKILVPFVLTVCVFLCLAGTGLALIPLLIIALYGIVRAAQILRQGQGRKRLFIGVVVVGLVLFSVTDYFASLLSYEAKLFDWNLTPNTVQSGYSYGEIIDKSNNHYLFYAVPAFASHSPSRWYHLLPGGSLLLRLLRGGRLPETGERSFAVDESGVIRVAPHWIPGTAVTCEEALRWQVLQ